MRLLPSEIQAQLETALSCFFNLPENSSLILSEPCNCGHYIRHNNGGNYHEIIYLTRDCGRWFVKYDSTSQFMSDPQWEEVAEEEALKVIENRVELGYYVDVEDRDC
jgi:sarcosine oxidase delta subunit